MTLLSRDEATEKLATGVERARPSDLPEIYAELFPEGPRGTTPVASEIAELIRSGIEAKEVVDLWNVVFPQDHNVWYDEEDRVIHFNDEMVD